MTMTIPSRFELAQLVIETLEAQKKYFKTRSKEDLIASKQLESKLRLIARGIIEEEMFHG